MRRNVRRWLYGAGVLAAAGAMTCGPGLASASTNSPRLSADASQAAVYVPPNHNFNLGARGAAVASVQRRLNQLHYYAGPVDGIYGQDLEWAVWAFKRVQGLPMNQYTNSLVTYAFRRDLVHPKAPPVLVPKGGASRVEINLWRQVLVLYKYNQVQLILDISTGGGYWYNGLNSCTPGTAGCEQAVTIKGNYHAAYFIAGWDKVPLGYMYNPVMFNTEYGQAMHGGDPVPWYPASHGCVRLQEDVQNWFHKRLSVGGAHPTPVYVRGIAPYFL